MLTYYVSVLFVLGIIMAYIYVNHEYDISAQDPSILLFVIFTLGTIFTILSSAVMIIFYAGLGLVL